jgi:hypothetical protein
MVDQTTSYTKAEYPNRTYIFTCTSSSTYDEPGTYTPTVTYLSDIYVLPKSTAQTTITARHPVPYQLILTTGRITETTDGDIETTIALERSREGTMPPLVGEALLQVKMLHNGKLWYPDTQPISIEIDASFGNVTMRRNRSQERGILSGTLRSAIAGRSVVTARFAGVQSNPVTITFTRNENDQGVYEALVEPGGGTVFKDITIDIPYTMTPWEWDYGDWEWKKTRESLQFPTPSPMTRQSWCVL